MCLVYSQAPTEGQRLADTNARATGRFPLPALLLSSPLHPCSSPPLRCACTAGTTANAFFRIFAFQLCRDCFSFNVYVQISWGENRKQVGSCSSLLQSYHWTESKTLLKEDLQKAFCKYYFILSLDQKMGSKENQLLCVYHLH